MPSQRLSITLPERYRKLVQALAAKNGNPSEAAEASRIVMGALDEMVANGLISEAADETEIAASSYKRVLQAATDGGSIEPGDLEIAADHAGIPIAKLKELLKLGNGHAATANK